MPLTLGQVMPTAQYKAATLQVAAQLSLFHADFSFLLTTQAQVWATDQKAELLLQTSVAEMYPAKLCTHLLCPFALVLKSADVHGGETLT